LINYLNHCSLLTKEHHILIHWLCFCRNRHFCPWWG